MIYKVYILKKLVVYFLLILFSLLELYLLFDLIEHVRLVLAYQGENSLVFYLGLSHIPTAVYQLIPLAVLLSCLILMMQLARDREILILASSGQSVYKRILPFIFFGLLCSILMISWGEYIVPKAENHYRYLMDVSLKHKQQANYKWQAEQKWFAGSSGLWQIASKEGSKLTDVKLYMFDKEHGYAGTLKASSMTYKNNRWQIENPKHYPTFKNSDTLDFVNKLELGELPEHFKMIWKAAEGMNFAELEYASKLKQSQGFDAKAYQTESWFRFGLPLICIALPLLASGFAFRRGQIGKKPWKFFSFVIGITISLFVFLSVNIIKALALIGVVHPGIGIFAFNILLFLLGMFWLKTARL